MQQPILAQYNLKSEGYEPAYGDFIIISNWFSKYYGFVIGVENNAIEITYSSLPFFTIISNDSRREKMKIDLDEIRNDKTCRYAIARFPIGSVLWFV